MWTKKFWKQTAERAIKTSAATAAGLVSGNGVGVCEVDWLGVLSITAMSAIVCVLTSIASLPVGPDKQTPSLV